MTFYNINDYEKALKKRQRAIESSNVDTNDEEEARRAVKQPQRLGHDFSDSEENLKYKERTDSPIKQIGPPDLNDTRPYNEYSTVLQDLSTRLQDLSLKFKYDFKSVDLCNLNFIDIAQKIDPTIWNFHYFLSQTKHEWQSNKHINFFDTPLIPPDCHTSPHIRNRVLRTLFTICHNLFQVTKGECANPLHILLGDTVDSYSGSSKLSTILNSFGILSSKIKCRQHVSAIVEEKISTKFLEDLDRAAFTVVSIDNIDVGQPHASAKINDPQRGIHATSYQALQPKPNTLNISSSEALTTGNRVSMLSFLQNDVEKLEVTDIRKNVSAVRSWDYSCIQSQIQEAYVKTCHNKDRQLH
ncbi:unnamed protein product [Mytilus edulis]|uniref:Uncharacterized protein n=1 Tax=Mytilus edulis TaxID=6550 RepID=A0A8S3T4L5_MYTED|nr:unnamed protein product [Mytilus edulis]